jgi:hypothetical protein
MLKPSLSVAPDRSARLDAAARQPGGERLRMMVAAEAAAERGVGLDHGSAAEFPAPHDKRVAEQSALL